MIQDVFKSKCPSVITKKPVNLVNGFFGMRSGIQIVEKVKSKGKNEQRKDK